MPILPKTKNATMPILPTKNTTLVAATIVSTVHLLRQGLSLTSGVRQQISLSMSDICMGNDCYGSRHNESESGGISKGLSDDLLQQGQGPEELQFPLHRYDWWVDDIATVLGCGKVKCAYYSKASVLHNSTSTKYGYIISQERYRSSFKEQQLTAEDANQLGDRYQIKHGYIGMPKRLNVTKQQNKNILSSLKLRNARGRYSPTHMRKEASETDEDFQKLFRKTQLIVQPIKLAPTDSIFWGCFSEKSNHAHVKITEYAETHPPLSPLAYKHMKKTLLFDYNATNRFMSNLTDASCYQGDMQMMIDPVGGSIFHIDMDRCFNEKAEKKTFGNHWSGCSKKFKTFLNHVLVSRGGEKHFDAPDPPENPRRKIRRKRAMALYPQAPPNITKLEPEKKRT